MAMFKYEEDAATVYVGGIAPDVTEAILEELFSQIGPVAAVRIPAAPDRSVATTSRLRVQIQGAPPSNQESIAVAALRGIFEPFGSVLAFDCVSPSDAFVVYDNSQSCQNAVNKLHGMALGQQALHTRPAPLVDNRFAFVTFKGPESVLYAARVLNGVILFGKQITVEKKNDKQSQTADHDDINSSSSAAPDSVVPTPDSSIATVSHLCSTLTHVDIRDLLEWAARDSIVDMKLSRMTASLRPARKAIATFESSAGAERVLAALHGKKICGIKVSVMIGKH